MENLQLVPNVLDQPSQSKNIFILKDYLKAPIFAAYKQDSGRTVIIKKENKIYEIGGFNPFNNSNSTRIYPAFDVRHFKAILTILSFRDNYDHKEGDSKISFSLTEFCRRYSKSSNSNGGSNGKLIKSLLEDLANCWVRVTYPNGEKLTYRVLKDVVIHSKPRRNKTLQVASVVDELWLDHVELNSDFQKLLSDYTDLASINLATLVSITSPLAQSIYIYIPSRAIYRNRQNPFPITLVNLLKEVGYSKEDIPKKKSLRKQLFTQNKNSILNQLKGVALSQGSLGLSLEETEDGSDYKLLFWNEEAQIKQEKEQKTICINAPNLRKAWAKSNRAAELFEQRIANLNDLNSYQEGLLKAANVEIIGNELFIKQSLALLGENRFNEMAAEVKSMVLEPGKNIKHPTKFFISQVLQFLSQV